MKSSRATGEKWDCFKFFDFYLVGLRTWTLYLSCIYSFKNIQCFLTLNPLLFSSGLKPVVSSSRDQSRITSLTIGLFRSTNLNAVIFAPPNLNSSRSNKSKSWQNDKTLQPITSTEKYKEKSHNWKDKFI